MGSKTIEKLRIYGNLGVIAGQFVLIFQDKNSGLVILLLCSAMNIPYSLRKKYYDVVLLVAVGMAINLAGLLFSK